MILVILVNISWYHHTSHSHTRHIEDSGVVIRPYKSPLDLPMDLGRCLCLYTGYKERHIVTLDPIPAHFSSNHFSRTWATCKPCREPPTEPPSTYKWIVETCWNQKFTAKMVQQNDIEWYSNQSYCYPSWLR